MPPPPLQPPTQQRCGEATREKGIYGASSPRHNCTVALDLKHCPSGSKNSSPASLVHDCAFFSPFCCFVSSPKPQPRHDFGAACGVVNVSNILNKAKKKWKEGRSRDRANRQAGYLSLGPVLLMGELL